MNAMLSLFCSKSPYDEFEKYFLIILAINFCHLSYIFVVGVDGTGDRERELQLGGAGGQCRVQGGIH